MLKSYEVTIVNKVVTLVKYFMKFIPIKRKIPSTDKLEESSKYVESDNIGSLDFEVIECNDGI